MTNLAIDPELLARFEALGVALGVGLLMGVERGWKERAAAEGARTAGVRTFALIGLLGGVIGLLGADLGGVVLAVGFLGFAVAFAAFELMDARADKTQDATPMIAGLVAFALGALAALGYLRVAAAAGVAATLLLALKEGLHRWIAALTWEELRAGLLLAAMTVILLPVLPDAPVDPWGAINPRAIWLMTILIAAVSFAGYIAVRAAGPSRGPLIAGLAAGMVSSTAAVVGFARRARDAGRGALLAGAVIANAVMFARVLAVAGVLRPELAPSLALALLPAAAVMAFAAAWLARRAAAEAAADVPPVRNPLELPTALQFGALLALVGLAAAWLETLFGAAGVYALAGVSGLADVDALTLAMTRADGAARDVAVVAILIAVAANTVSKSVIAWIAGGRPAGIAIGAASAAALAAGAAGFALSGLWG